MNMDELAERLTRLERQMRRYRVLTLALLLLLIVIFVCIAAWLTRLTRFIPIEHKYARGLTIVDEKGRHRLSMSASEAGWAIKSYSGTALRPETTGTITYAVSEQTPVLTLTEQ